MVRDALRNFRLPHELARSPLAAGSDPVSRVEHVRGMLTRGYLEPSQSHEQVAYELSLSRAAYFRRLRIAAERVAQHLGSSD